MKRPHFTALDWLIFLGGLVAITLLVVEILRQAWFEIIVQWPTAAGLAAIGVAYALIAGITELLERVPLWFWASTAKSYY